MTKSSVRRGRRSVGDRRRLSLLASIAVLVLAGPGGLVAGAGARIHGHSSRAAWLDGRGMWIWVLTSSNGGNLNSIVSTAHRYGVRTLMIKSSDGTSPWSQFNSGLVRTLHANHLRVCAWQYVYGNDPAGEAKLGAAAVQDGADCLLIDAEIEYEGKYVQAQTYVSKLRKLIGASFPVALAGFPYVDYHPAFPYSVFLGPGGAQYNVPQMYWAAIGTTVDAVYAHTYTYNRVYGRPIDPLGQVYNNPPASQIIRFRQLSRAYGAQNVSWWDWQQASKSAWKALSRGAPSLRGYTPSAAYPVLKKGMNGDLVVWAQEHLLTAGYTIPVDGGFGPKTLAAVKGFQQANALTVDGVVGPMTWQALLRYAPAPVKWAKRGARSASVSGRNSLTLMVPKSARLPAKRDEIAGAGGAGRPN